MNIGKHRGISLTKRDEVPISCHADHESSSNRSHGTCRPPALQPTGKVCRRTKQCQYEGAEL